MNGRELIMCILENHLEDTPIFEDGALIGFMTEIDAAAKFGVGVGTVRMWVKLGMLYGFEINDTIYIPMNAKNPKEELNA